MSDFLYPITPFFRENRQKLCIFIVTGQKSQIIFLENSCYITFLIHYIKPTLSQSTNISDADDVAYPDKANKHNH